MQSSFPATARLRHLLAALATVFAVLYAALILPGHAVLLGRDSFLFWDGIYRVASGQVPHVDFEVALGALNFWGPAAFWDAASPFMALPIYFFVSGLILSVVCALLVHGRTGRWTGLVAVLLIAALGAGLTEFSSSEASYHGYYRRIGGATFVLLSLYPFVSTGQSSGRRVIADGVLLAVLLYVALFTKISYAAVDLVLLGMAAVLWPATRRPIVLATALLLVAVGLTEAAAPGIVVGYARNLALVQAAHGPWRLGIVPEELTDAPNLFLVVAPLVVLAWRTPLRRERAAALLFGATVVAGWHVLDGLDAGHRGWAGTAGLAVGCCGVLELAGSGAPADRRLRAAALVALVCTLMLSSPLVVSAARSIQDHNLAPQDASSEPLFGRRLVVPRRLLDEPSAVADEAARASPGISRAEYLTTGVELIAAAALSPADSRLFVFDLANPFSMLCGLPPPRNTKLYVHVDYNISAACKPRARTLLGDVTVVMVPIFPVAPRYCRFLLGEYGPFLTTEFREAGRNRAWVLYERVVPGGVEGDILECGG